MPNEVNPPALHAEEISDLFPGRKRRVRLAAPQQMDETHAKAWINHEARRDIALTYSLEVTVAGWRNANGDLYKPGQVYAINHPHLYSTDGRVLMVGAVTYRRSVKDGQICTLRLSSPKAWIEGYVPIRPASDGAGGGLADRVQREKRGEAERKTLAEIIDREKAHQ